MHRGPPGKREQTVEVKFVAGLRFRQAKTSCKFHNQADLFSFRMLPPSTTRDCPVMYEAAGDAKKHTAAATSSGVPARLRGVCNPAIRSASVDDAVAIHPGATALDGMMRAIALEAAEPRLLTSGPV